ncbi:MAG TPA: helix-turn-helix transcriptional regulator [Blastocatellia bacterium]|nr:helix-turn-helix transcriptional regulator [Blastocatellia bacterium]
MEKQKCFIYSLSMDVTTDIASVAALVGEPARAVMLWSLVDGQARPAGELAFYANVSAQSASAHLSKLVAAEMLKVEDRGRHRYYRIATPEVALAIEAMAALAPSAKVIAGLPRGQTPDVKFARTCYDHLAGKVAVEICRAMLGHELLAPSGRDFLVTPKGEQWFINLGIEVSELRRQRRAFARQCPDWSERQPHIAGALGAALLDTMFRRSWIVRDRSARIIRLTTKGRSDLQALLRLNP